MRLQDFDYNLPPELIAQEPARPRDHSRLLVMRRLAAIPRTRDDHANDVVRKLAAVNGDHANINNEDKKYAIEHKHFYDIVDYLQKGDVLVLNNSKVFPARLIGKKAGTGGTVEVFLLKKEDNISGLTACEAVKPLLA